MNDNETPVDADPDQPAAKDNVVSIEAWKQAQEADPPKILATPDTVLGGGDNDGSVWPQAKPPSMRRYIIEIKNDVIEAEGYVGLTGFGGLAIGNKEGMITLGIAPGEWTMVVDITDSGKSLSDYVKDKE